MDLYEKEKGLPKQSLWKTSTLTVLTEFPKYGNRLHYQQIVLR